MHTSDPEMVSLRLFMCRRPSGILLQCILAITGSIAQLYASDIVVHPTGEYLVELSPGANGIRALENRANIAAPNDWSFKSLRSGGEKRGGERALGADVESVEWVIAVPPRTTTNISRSRLLNAEVIPKVPLPQTAGEAWDVAYRELSLAVRPELPSIMRTASARGMGVLAIEPNLVTDVKMPACAMGSAKISVATGPDAAAVSSLPNPTWPSKGGFAWHLKSDARVGTKTRSGYSQLKEARDDVAKLYLGGMQPVLIAHLDTGYDPNHVTLPRYFRKDLSITLGQDGKPVSGQGVATDSHGAGSLGLLAGKRIRVVNPDGTVFDDTLGGAPDAQVFSVNIDAGAVAILHVVHLATAPMGSAIFYATDAGADVITISAGGVPSKYWANAVNYAYTHGVPIFAASGDFFTFPVIGIAITPYRTVYPAAFRRVEAVTGVTSNYRSYGFIGDWAALLPWNWSLASMRGSFGPPSAMLHAIAGYAPNVPWAQMANKASGDNQIRVDGSGTSTTTPQVAAAAALWIAAHKKQLQRSTHGWQRAEAVYEALEAGTDRSKNKPLYLRQFVGVGLLHAVDALNQPIPPNMKPRTEAIADLSWIRLLLPIDEDGILIRSLPGFAISKKGEEAFEKMLGLEAAQLIARSKELQKITASIDLTNPREQPDSGTAKRVALAMIHDSDCSTTLRTLLRAKMEK
jgi:Subtilase family